MFWLFVTFASLRPLLLFYTGMIEGLRFDDRGCGAGACECGDKRTSDRRRGDVKRPLGLVFVLRASAPRSVLVVLVVLRLIVEHLEDRAILGAFCHGEIADPEAVERHPDAGGQVPLQSLAVLLFTVTVRRVHGPLGGRDHTAEVREARIPLAEVREHGEIGLHGQAHADCLWDGGVLLLQGLLQLVRLKGCLVDEERRAFSCPGEGRRRTAVSAVRDSPSDLLLPSPEVGRRNHDGVGLRAVVDSHRADLLDADRPQRSQLLLHFGPSQRSVRHKLLGVHERVRPQESGLHTAGSPILQQPVSNGHRRDEEHRLRLVRGRSRSPGFEKCDEAQVMVGVRVGHPDALQAAQHVAGLRARQPSKAPERTLSAVEQEPVSLGANREVDARHVSVL
eukprot:scaffold7337_cov220-Pinguiococcus_pyrenoidosus.AAC.2